MKRVLRTVLPILMLTAFSLCGCDDFLDDEDWEVEEEIAEDVGENESDTTGQSGQGEIDNINVEPVNIYSGAESATILVYMNGSDLETKAGVATNDISEMIGSGVGDNVNVIIETLGTKNWHDYGISSEKSQIYRIKDKQLELLEDDLGQLDCTVSDTLSDFIDYGKKNFPADRYMLIFWDHGGGPVYGFGYDEWQDDSSSLTLDEIQKALRDNSDISFDIIGMDCCIMANLETCYVLAPFCRYAVLSEDFESEIGWSYKEWMSLFESNPGISAPLLGKKIIDSMIEANENDYDRGGSSTMILVNESAVGDLVNKWMQYAYENSDKLTGSNYSKLHKAIGKGLLDSLFEAWEDDDSYVTMDDFYVSDMLSIVESAGAQGQAADDLRASLKACVAYFGHTSDKNELTGLAVSLPYGDGEYYDKLVDVYSKCGFDEKYIDWLGGFVTASGCDDYCDYSQFEDSWCGWSTYEEGWSSCDTTEDSEDWEYDYEEKIWYLIEDGNVYFYDDETDMMFVYDEYEDAIYYYDDEDDEWYLAED
ncbi:MAG: hypothetical protein E7298_12825 [Lachnospiraceae bacterium]|nr:hypothetical protein [Lachnospiraceae bacterium]MBQ6320270.1 hypothetical protein [Lachnospiraceae bacterium]